MNTIQEDIKMVNDFISAMGGKDTPSAMKRIEKQIAELQEKLKDMPKYEGMIEFADERIRELKDTIRRRNLQIKNLTKQLHKEREYFTNSLAQQKKDLGY